LLQAKNLLWRSTLSEDTSTCYLQPDVACFAASILSQAVLANTNMVACSYQKFAEPDLSHRHTALNLLSIVPNSEMSQYAIRPVSSSGMLGMGVFATKDIQRGSLIMATAPEICIEQPASNSISAMVVLQQYKRLDEATQLKYCDLHPGSEANIERYLRELRDTDSSNEPPLSPVDCKLGARIAAILHNNAFGFRDAAGKSMQGLHILPSRFNHSCTPNVCHTWNDREKNRTFRATKSIPNGEQLTIAYIPLLQSYDDRAKTLVDHFGIICVCEACQVSTAFAKKSEKRRAELAELDFDRLLPPSHSWLGVCTRMIELLEDEGIVGWEKGEM
jgi:hypothetical protein